MLSGRVSVLPPEKSEVPEHVPVHEPAHVPVHDPETVCVCAPDDEVVAADEPLTSVPTLVWTPASTATVPPQPCVCAPVVLVLPLIVPVIEPLIVPAVVPL